MQIVRMEQMRMINDESFVDMLRRPKALYKAFLEAIDRTERLRAACSSTTPKYSGAGGGGSGEPQKDEKLILLADASVEMKDIRRRQIESVMEARRFFEEAEIPERDKRVLLHRVVNDRSVEKTQQLLAEDGYPCCRSSVYTWTGEALSRGEAEWRKMNG